ncbi:MAG: serine--tRNA ligase [Acidobacteriaceae bacterium]|nr:serine--tRNA ligase [Acidobacteriaceae bacterium]
MHDLNFFRNNLDTVRERLSTRGYTLDLEAFQELDRRRRQWITDSEQLKAERNQMTAGIAKLRKEGQDTTVLQQKARMNADLIRDKDEQVAAVDREFQDLLKTIPNLTQPDVNSHSEEIRRWGAPPEFSFTPKAHWDLGTALGILDLERAAKVSGARFAFYSGLGARLERALANFMLDLHTTEHGYREVFPPFLVNYASLYGTGQMPKFAEDLFKCEGHELWLAPTAEVQVTNLFRDETLNADALPVSFCAYSSNFRSEAGSYGRDVRGIIRQHQFQKVELVKFTHPDHSNEQHERLTRDAENVLQRLGLAYRTIRLAADDTGFSSAKTYDIEVWLPGLNAYKEISSCSNFEAFQARRAQIRMKSGKGKAEFVHTLNGSGLAVGRTWAAIVENYQQADGSVLIPPALQPYLRAERIVPESGSLV